MIISCLFSLLQEFQQHEGRKKSSESWGGATCLQLLQQHRGAKCDHFVDGHFPHVRVNLNPSFQAERIRKQQNLLVC